MPCYIAYYDHEALRIFTYKPHGNDWRRARVAAIEWLMARANPQRRCIVRHFSATDSGTIVWE